MLKCSKKGESRLWDGKPNVPVYSFLKMLLCLAKVVKHSLSGIKYGVWILPQQSCRKAFSVTMCYSGKLQVHVDTYVCVCVYLCAYVCVCAWTPLESKTTVLWTSTSHKFSFKFQLGWQCFLVKLFFIHFCEIFVDTENGDFVFLN